MYRAGPHVRRLKVRPRERLVAYAVRLGYPLPDAEDLVQAAYLLLLYRWQRGEPIGDWFGFLAGCIEKSGVSTRTRERRRSKLLEQQPPTDATDRGHEDRVIAGVLTHRVLDGLPLADANLLRWRFPEDRPIREIAEHLDIPEGTVKSRVHGALKKARGVMGIERPMRKRE
ncbi:MAG: sigma-70 family RNA polymerase sigma factor [Longimicrobiales bacterium]